MFGGEALKDIKTRELQKDIKTMDKTLILAERIKNTTVQTKKKAEQGISSYDNSPNEYATDHTEQSLGAVKDKVIYEFNKQGQKGIEETKQNISKARDFIQSRRNGGVYSRENNSPKPSENPVSEQIRTLEHDTKTIGQSRSSVGRTTVKTAEKHIIKKSQKSVKTAEKTSIVVKTAQQSAKAAKKTAQATAEASQRATQAARVAVKATATTVKAAAKATVETVKTIIAGTKALVAAIVAGGWLAVVIIVILCLVALIVGSCFGIFFSGESNGSGQTIQTAIQDISLEYQAKIEEIKATHTYDVLEILGSQATWKEVLAIYAVKVTTDSDNPQEVFTVDDAKKEKMKSIFWNMNEISSRTQLKTETVIETNDNGLGNIVETEKTITRMYLYINMSHKTAEEMADQYNFKANQRKQLAELLSDDNNKLWDIVLYNSSK